MGEGCVRIGEGRVGEDKGAGAGAGEGEGDGGVAREGAPVPAEVGPLKDVGNHTEREAHSAREEHRPLVGRQHRADDRIAQDAGPALQQEGRGLDPPGAQRGRREGRPCLTATADAAAAESLQLGARGTRYCGSGARLALFMKSVFDAMPMTAVPQTMGAIT